MLRFLFLFYYIPWLTWQVRRRLNCSFRVYKLPLNGAKCKSSLPQKQSNCSWSWKHASWIWICRQVHRTRFYLTEFAFATQRPFTLDCLKSAFSLRVRRAFVLARRGQEGIGAWRTLVSTQSLLVLKSSPRILRKTDCKQCILHSLDSHHSPCR